MTQKIQSTCQELLKELQDLQGRFRLFFETKRYSPTLKLTENISIFQEYLNESQKLAEDAQALKQKFTPPEVQNLLEKMEEQYEDAKNMALEFDPGCEIPSKELVMEKIRALGTERLREIAKFGQPTLLMTPPTSMTEKKKVLNEKRRFPEQAVSRWGKDADDEFWDPKPEKLTISMVDGLPTPPPPPPQISYEILKDKHGRFTGILKIQAWDFQYKKMNEQFKEKGIRMIKAHEYAVLMQLSLANYKKAKEDQQHRHHQSPENEIIDFTTNKNAGQTVFYQPENIVENMREVPFGCFYSKESWVCFFASPRDLKNEYCRFRGAMEVFSF